MLARFQGHTLMIVALYNNFLIFIVLTLLVEYQKSCKTVRVGKILMLRRRLFWWLLWIVSTLLTPEQSFAWISSSSLISMVKTTTTTMMTAVTAGTSSSSSTSSSSNKNYPLPKLQPLPEPIRSNVPGTWAYDTMSRRVDSEILQRTYEENKERFESKEFQELYDRFCALRSQLQAAETTKLTYLEDLPEEGSSEERQREHAEWTRLLEPYILNGDTWLTAPWLVTEFYLYRLLLQALRYWDPTSPGYMYDPFQSQKRAGLYSSVGSAEAMLAKLPALPKTSEGITLAAAFALWGNKMDLSLWPADAANTNIDIFSSILASANDNLLHDDSNALADHCEKLRNNGGGMVDIIVDNAGFELVTDLALAEYLVESGIAKVVTFQLKSHPTFVSDALEKDLLETVEHYANLDKSQYPNAQASGSRWLQFLKTGSWICHEDNFWVQPFPMWEMTEPLRTDMMTRCDLAFVKGDANYRRLLGDRMWNYSAPFSDVVGCYFPCPVCALRTLKAELGCEMDPEQVERAMSLDPNWLVNGRFGVVHFGIGCK
jgi:Damage-control phosphatase ARMT1-like domain